MKNIKLKSIIKQGFTLIELLIIVAIIAILVTAIYASIGSARKKSRINAAKVSLKTTLPAIIACLDDRTNVTPPKGNEGLSICNNTNRGLKKANWPELTDYNYITDNINTLGNPDTCFFEIDTTLFNGDKDTINPLKCDCKTQKCEEE